MPWLIKNKLLFCHIPRCGGTSLLNHYDVDKNVVQGGSLYHKIGMKYFTYRYNLLKKSNFPIVTIENFIASVQLTIALVLIIIFQNSIGYYMIVSSLIMSFTSTFLLTSVVSGRYDVMRKLYFFIIGRLMYEVTASYEYLYGVGSRGYIMHWTGEEILTHLKNDKNVDMEKVKSFAVVRNPFSRMVSIYLYNRFTQHETFRHFVREWYGRWKIFQDHGDPSKVFCHILPQKKFTHNKYGEQIIDVVVKQEMIRLMDDIVKACYIDNKLTQVPKEIQDV